MIKKILFVLFLILTNMTAYCCSCGDKPSIEKNWELADQVFVAKILKVDSWLYNSYGNKVYSFTIQIKKSYKDQIYDGQVFRDILAVSSGSCDFFFTVGEEYLIYSHIYGQALACSICSRTNLVKNVRADEFELLERLNKKSLKSNQVKIRKFKNDTEYQVDLVKDSFEEKLKRKDLVIYILSSLSFILFIILIIVLLKKKLKRSI